MRNTQLWGWIKVYKFFFLLGVKKSVCFCTFFPKSIWPQGLPRYMITCSSMQKALKTLLPCNWSYTCKPRSSLVFWAVVSGNLPCYINMNLAEKSLDLLGNLFKMLSFSGQPLDLSIPPLLLMLCYIRKGWAWEQCLSCCFQNCDYQLIIIILLLFHPFNTHCFVHTYCIPYKYLLHLKARSKSRWAEPHHNLHLYF